VNEAVEVASDFAIARIAHGITQFMEA